MYDALPSSAIALSSKFQASVPSFKLYLRAWEEDGEIATYLHVVETTILLVDYCNSYITAGSSLPAISLLVVYTVNT